MPSIWEKEHKLKRWVKKNQKKLFDFNFDFDLMDIKSDPLLYYLSKNLNIENNYIYTSAGISQLINSILTLPRWTNIYIIKNEFALYERTLDIYEKKKKIINEGNFESLIKFFKNYKSLDTDLFCFSSPRWYNGVNITIKELEELQYYFKGNIIIDEAYFDYSNNLNGFINYCLENDNIILFRSFSKKFFMPGLRVGYMITKVHFDHIRDTIIPPHSISTLSSRLAVSLLRDAKLLNYFNNINKYIINCRKYLYKNLNIKYKECTIYNSESNFLTIQFRSIVNYMKFYMKIKDFPGIQCFEEKKFIKIWITNMDICQKIVNAIND